MTISAIQPILEDLSRQLEQRYGYQVRATTTLRGGSNNRLFRVEHDAGTPLLLKVYWTDDRRRLDREFRTLSFLQSQGFTNVPTVYFCNDALNYGVYSFEPGVVTRAVALSAMQMIDLAHWAAALHRFGPDRCPESFPSAIAASFSIADCIQSIELRLHGFLTAVRDPMAPEPIRALCARVAIQETFATLIAGAMRDYSAIDLCGALPRTRWRISTSDFAPHNVLIRPDGGVCVVDFEYAGWEDPARMMMGFVCHDASLDLNDAQRQAFLLAYQELAGITKAESDRFRRMRTWLEIEWAAIHLTALTPAKLQIKRFNCTTLDVDGYIQEQIAKFEHRLCRAQM